MKLGIIVDSSSGLIETEAIERGWGYLPLSMTIDNQDFEDGINIIPREYYKSINVEKNVKTAATFLGRVIHTLEEFSKKYDHVIVYTLSHKLSSQNNNVKSIATSLPNVHVVLSQGVGFAIVKQLEIIEKEYNGSNFNELKEKIERISASTHGILIPYTMQWLVKGGRVSSSVASMAKMLKIVPMISFQNGELGKFGKGRVFEKTIEKMAQSLKKIAPSEAAWLIYDAGNPDLETHKNIINKIIGHDIEVKFLPPVIGNHTGPNAIALVYYLKN